MTDAYLFTLPNLLMGPAATDLFLVKGMTELVIAAGGREWHYQKGGGSTTTPIKSGGMLLGVQLLRGDDAAINLATIPDAVAVTVHDGRDCLIVWLQEGRCDKCSAAIWIGANDNQDGESGVAARA
jgi:hypothetical protein